jgi:uncharacterized protein (TIGR03435 family)
MIPPSFDAASVKPSSGSTGLTVDPGLYRVRGITLRGLIVQAYHLKRYEYSGPSWLDNERYDVDAKVPAGTTSLQRDEMLKTLLSDRFRLQFHREPREMTVYDLVVASTGSKLQQATAYDSGPAPKIIFGPDRFPVIPPGSRATTTSRGVGGQTAFVTNKLSIAQLADYLSSELEAPVLDKTGLAGQYSFLLHFASGRNDVHSTPSKKGSLAGDDSLTGSDRDLLPTVFEAIRAQLGLQLNRQKGSVEVFIVDKADRIPVEN